MPRKWEKGGPSPNPGGRPKEIGHVVELARQHTEEAIEALVEIVNDRTAGNVRARVTAANALLDRAWGRAPQAVYHGGLDEVPHALRIELVKADDAE